MSNLDLWDKVAKTDPAYTKGFNQGFSGTSINSTYLVKKATEQWGMIGLGWGYDIAEERVDNGGPVYNDAGEILGHIQTHTIKLCLWVKQGEQYSRVEHFGHTPYTYYSAKNNKWITDQEAPKKSLTDALKKCLSMHGFSADIFLGLYDDFNYVEEVKAQSQIDKADDKDAERARQQVEYEEWKAEHLKLIETATNLNELKLLFTGGVRKAERRKDDAAVLVFTKAKDARKKELESK